MTIVYKEEQKNNEKLKATLEIDNGDLQALKEVMEQYNFINQEALLRYALVSLLKSSDNKLYIRQNGNILAVNISDNLIKKEDIQNEQ